MPGKRRTAREMAVQMLYQQDMGGASPEQLFGSFDLEEYLRREGVIVGAAEDDESAEEPAGDVPDDWELVEEGTPALAGNGQPQAPEARREAAERARRRVREAFEHARRLVAGTHSHREEIDALIRSQADNWRLERMPVVDRNILRLAVYEMLYTPEVPKLVVLDEAIELAKSYGSDQSSRFVNGLLDGLLKEHAFPGSLQ